MPCQASWMHSATRFALIASLMVTGCGAPPSVPNHASVDDALVSYFKRFSSEVGVSSDGVSGEFATLKAPILGQCTKYSDGSKLIQVDREHWYASNDAQREQLIFHELGHCALGLAHDATLDQDNCPVSIMYPYAFGDSLCYSAHHGDYIAELASHK